MRAGVPCCLRNEQPRDTKGIAVVSKGIARCGVSTWAEQCWARPEQWPGQARLAVEGRAPRVLLVVVLQGVED